MQKLTPTQPAGHQSIHRSTVTINTKYGSFSFSRKAKEVLKLGKGSKFDFIEHKGIYYVQPNKDGAFTLGEKTGTKGRLFANDKGIAQQIKTSYRIKTESFILSVSEKGIVVVDELNCFSINK